MWWAREMRWTWAHYPYMMIYISSASKCWKRFCLVSSEKLPNIECFLPFFALVLVLSFGARSMQFLVLFFMFRVVRYFLSLGAVGRDMERNQSQNQRMWEEQDDNSGKEERWEKREQSVEWWNEWGWLSICHIWKQACNITYYYGITMDIMPTF